MPVIIIASDDVTPAELSQLLAQAKLSGSLPEPVGFVPDKKSPPPYDCAATAVNEHQQASKLSDLVAKMRATDYGAMPPTLPCGCDNVVACEKCTPNPEPLRLGDRVEFIGRKPGLSGLTGLYRGVTGTVKSAARDVGHVTVEWDKPVWDEGIREPRVSFPAVENLRLIRRAKPPELPVPEIVGELMTAGFAVSGESRFELAAVRQVSVNEPIANLGEYRARVRVNGFVSHASGVNPMDAVYNAVNLARR